MARRPKRDLLRPSPETLESRKLMASASISVDNGELPHSPGGTFASFTIHRSGTPTPGAVTLKYSGSAVQNLDYGFYAGNGAIQVISSSREIVVAAGTNSFAIGVEDDSGAPRGTVQLNLQVVGPDGNSPPNTPTYTPSGSAAVVVIADQAVNNPESKDPESTGVGDPADGSDGIDQSPVTGNASSPGPAAPASPGLPRGGPAGPPVIPQVYDNPGGGGDAEVPGDDGGYGGGDSDVPPATIYGSDNAHPIVTADLYIPQESSSNELVATLTLGGNAIGVPSVTSTTYYANPTVSAGGVFRFALQVDASSLPTNSYFVSIVVSATSVGSTTSTQVAAVTGRYEVVNRANSDYGLNQALSNEEILVAAPDVSGLSWVRPDGSYTFFAPAAGGGYAAAGGSYATIAATSGGYAITENDGVVYKFTSSPVGYRLTEKDDSDGDADLYTYNAAGDILTYRDAFGRTSTYTYAQPSGGGPTQQMLSTVTDFAGRVTTYSDSPVASHWAVTSIAVSNPNPPANNAPNPTATTLYTYDPTTGQELTSTDPAGDVTSITYDPGGDYRVRSIAELASGDTIDPTTGSPFSAGTTVWDVTSTVASDEFGLRPGTSPASVSTLGAAPPLSTLVAATVTRSVLVNGTTQLTPPPRTTTSLINSLGVATQVTQPKALATDPGGRVTATVTDAYGQPVLVQEIDADGQTLLRVTAFAYYPAGTSSAGLLQQVTFGDGSTESWGTYNADGEPTSYTDGDNFTTNYAYYPTGGLVQAVKDPLGLTTTYTYDTMGRVTSETTPAPGTTALAVSQNPTGYPTVTTSYVYYPNSYHDMLESVQTPDGDLTTFTYNPDDTLATTRDSAGRTTGFAYDGLGRVLAATDPLGRVTTFAYDNDGRLTKETEASPAGGTGTVSTTYVYDSQGRPWQVIEVAPSGSGAGPTTTFGYDGYGNLASVIDPIGTDTAYAYDGDDELIGSTRDFRNSGSVAPTPETTTYVYDGLGRVDEVIDPMSRATSFGHDAMDRVTSIVQVGGQGVANLLTTFAYDGDGNLTSETDPDGNAASPAYSTAYVYNALDQLVNVVRPPEFSTSTATETTTYTYDLLGDLLSEQDPLLRTTTYQYDAMGRLASTTEATPAGAAGGATTTVSSISYPNNPNSPNSSYGEVEVVTAPTSYGGPLAMTTYTYDADGELIQVQQPMVTPAGSSTPASPTTNYTYNPEGELATVTDADSHVTSYLYDALGLISLVQQPPPSSGGQIEQTLFLHDPDGNLTNVVTPEGNLAGHVEQTVYSYDALDRLKQSDQLGNTGIGGTSPDYLTEYTYNLDDQLKTVADPDAVAAGSAASPAYVTTYNYDSFGRLSSTVVPVAPGTAAGSTATTTIQYDSDGNAWIVDDPDGYATVNYYDDLGQVYKSIDPAGDVTSYMYDAAGDLTKKVVGNANIANSNVTTSYGYDADGRLSSEVAPASGATDATQSEPLETIAFAYDPADQVIGATDATTPAGSSTPTSLVTQADGYDADGRPAFSSLTISGSATPQVATFTLSYAYDQDGNLAFSQDSSGGSTTYARDWLGRLTAVVAYQNNASNTPTVVAEAIYLYDADGRVTQLSRNAGTSAFVNTTYTYDPVYGRLTSQHDFTGGGQLVATNLGYDPDGHLTSRSTNFAANGTAVAGSESIAYGYDRSGQLTSFTGSDLASSSVSASFAYDPAGNRTPSGTTATVADARVTNDGTNAYTFNAAGEVVLQTSDTNLPGTTTPTTRVAYAYDSFGRLVGVVNFAGTAQGSSESYAYDAAGDRVLVSTTSAPNGQGVSTTSSVATAYDGSTPYADITPAASPASSAESIRYLDGDAVDEVLGRVAVGAGNAVLWYVRDYEGSTRELVANGGSVVDQVTYGPFGALRAETNPGGGDRFKYAGGDYSAVSTLNYFEARYEMPSLGRWTQPDPIGFSGGDANLYRYVGNDPTDEVDVSGLLQGPARQITAKGLPGIADKDPNPQQQLGFLINKPVPENQYNTLVGLQKALIGGINESLKNPNVNNSDKAFLTQLLPGLVNMKISKDQQIDPESPAQGAGNTITGDSYYNVTRLARGNGNGTSDLFVAHIILHEAVHVLGRVHRDPEQFEQFEEFSFDALQILKNSGPVQGYLNSLKKDNGDPPMFPSK